MISQRSLFDLSDLPVKVELPIAPKLVPHNEWPFPGMTPEDSARAAIAASKEYADMLAAVIHSQGGAPLIGKQVLSLIPKDWRDLCGSYAHGSIGWTEGELRGVKSNYVSHDGAGFHFTYQAVN